MRRVAALLALLAAWVPAACDTAPEARSDAEAAGAPSRPPSGMRTRTGPAAGIPLAITFDDLPWNAPQYGRAAILERTERLLAALGDRHVPAVGFVTCRNLQPDGAAIRRWRQAGIELGNHGNSHLDLNRTDPENWLEDMRRCEERIVALTRARPRWVRYPMLHQGATVDVRDSVARALARSGYRNGHVTIDNSEWMLARAYDEAVRDGNAARREEIAAAYVDHLRDAARHFRQVARERFGRETGQVLLLHANALAADHAGAAIDALAADGFRIATLEEVLADSVFAMPDGYAGPRGLSWLYRVDPPVTDDPWDEAAGREITERF